MGRSAYTWLFALGALAAASGLGACSNDWDALDPRAQPQSVSTTGASGGGGAGASSTATSGGGGDGTGGGQIESVTVTYEASIAICMSSITPDVEACEGAEGAGHMSVDSANTSLAGEPSVAFIRFDPNDAPDGKTATGAVLKLTVIETDPAQTGELWQVEPFSLATLANAAPEKVGADPIGRDQGETEADAVISWAVPAALLADEASVYLGVFPLVSNHVNYGSENSATPPVLEVTYQ